MRHAIVLGIASWLFAMLMTLAWQFDQQRHNVAQERQTATLDAELDRLESTYLTQAHTLLTLANPAHPLLPAIEAARAALADVPGLAERETRFNQLTGEVRTALLGASTERFGEPQLQEWRRAQDQMNGALNRRQHLLNQAGIKP